MVLERRNRWLCCHTSERYELRCDVAGAGRLRGVLTWQGILIIV